MNAKELLLESKIRLKVSSDYELAKKLDIPRQRISEYMNEKVRLDAYALTKIAITLGKDPISLIAEYEAATEKNPIKQAFWQGFSSRAGKVVRMGTLALVFGISLLTGLNADKPQGFRRC
jgi:transcriptional regulator with XRE-family HTH domain